MSIEAENKVRLLIHFHAYYEELVDLYFKRLSLLNSVNCSYKLIVTIPKTISNESEEDAVVRIKNIADKAEKYISSDNYELMMVPNIGYDIGPFLSLINSVDLDSYDVILKLHTKNINDQSLIKLNGIYINREQWSKFLLEPLLYDVNTIDSILSEFKNNKNLNMAGSKYCFTSNRRLYKKHKHKVSELALMFGYSIDKLNNPRFCAGTMFYIRASLLKSIQNKVTIDLFDEDRVQRSSTDFSYAHAFERLFGIIATIEAGKCKEITYPIKESIKYYYWPMLKKLTHIFYENKKTSKKHTIKLLRITVYKKKVDALKQ
jgi:rhamnosyltransferase